MTTKSGYQRLKEWRLRQATGEEIPKCKICDRLVKGQKSLALPVCSYCYPKTPEGIQANKEAVNRHRAK